jgi:hypothetical protein
MNHVSIWRDALVLPLRHPLPFLAVSLLLWGTDIMLWRMGVYAGVGMSAGGGSAYLIVKVAILLVWALLVLRLMDAPGRSIGGALRLDRRQVGWLAGTLLVLSLLFGLRLALTRLAGLAFETGTALIAGLILYLPIALFLLVRLLPALIGALLGDRAASLGWSWRATAGRVLDAVLLVLLALAPLLVLHVGLNLLPMTQASASRVALLLIDGAAMALLIATAMASYRALYLRAKAAP